MSKQADWLDRALVVTPFSYCLILSEKKFQRELRRLNLPRNDWPQMFGHWHSDATTHFFENRGKIAQAAIVTLRNYDKKTREQIHAMLVHEAVHLWQHSVDEYGERSPSSEFMAYGIQTIAHRLMESFARQVDNV